MIIILTTDDGEVLERWNTQDYNELQHPAARHAFLMDLCIEVDKRIHPPPNEDRPDQGSND